MQPVDGKRQAAQQAPSAPIPAQRGLAVHDAHGPLGFLRRNELDHLDVLDISGKAIASLPNVPGVLDQAAQMLWRHVRGQAVRS
jgi:hypothetical protein